MATLLSVGDLAIVQYNSSTTDSFTFVFARDIEAGTVVNFTDNGWLAAGGFRPGEGTVTYTAPTAITAGTVVTLTGLDLDAAGDQIIAYQGTQASPTPVGPLFLPAAPRSRFQQFDVRGRQLSGRGHLQRCPGPHRRYRQQHKRFRRPLYQLRADQYPEPVSR